MCLGVGETHAVAVCKSGFFPANICTPWRDKADATRFGRECLYLLGSLGSLHSLSLTEVHIHPLTMVLNEIFWMFVYILCIIPLSLSIST